MKTINELKQLIKVLSSEQRTLKPQRKTVHFSGERTIDAKHAATTVRWNKFKLRHMYYAYAKLRRRDLTMVDSHPETLQMSAVDKIVKEYGNEPALRHSA